MEKNFRHEYKYLISRSAAELLRRNRVPMRKVYVQHAEDQLEEVRL